MQEPQSFFLIVADHDQGCFSDEGPMIKDRLWNNAARLARIARHWPLITNDNTNLPAFRQERSECEADQGGQQI